MASGNTLYTVKWPKAEQYRIKSASGVMVESNVQHQIALHFYNEIRELEDEIQYQEDGQKTGGDRPVAYVRELCDTLLISNGAALHLRDILNSVFPAQTSEDLN